MIVLGFYRRWLNNKTCSEDGIAERHSATSHDRTAIRRCRTCTGAPARSPFGTHHPPRARWAPRALHPVKSAVWCILELVDPARCSTDSPADAMILHDVFGRLHRDLILEMSGAAEHVELLGRGIFPVDGSIN